jgi:hypothetical protein
MVYPEVPEGEQRLIKTLILGVLAQPVKDLPGVMRRDTLLVRGAAEPLRLAETLVVRLAETAETANLPV